MPQSSRITRLSSWLYWLCSGLIFLIPLVILAAFAWGWATAEDLPMRFPGLPDGTTLTPAKAIIATLIGSPTLIPMAMALLQMRGLFGRYRAGEILSDACARHILRIGQSLIAFCALLIFTPTLQILALTADNPDGQKIVSISIDGAMIGLGLAGGLLVTIGWVMREASREIESFI